MIESILDMSLETLVVQSIAWATIGIMFAHFFPPFQWLKHWLFKRWRNEEYYWVISCPKCVTFWSSLFFTWNVLFAFIASLVAYFLDEMIRSFEEE
jgi:hypothetical protein